MDSARVVEIFSSLQGEGIYLGERQVFVRFGGCNLRCDYCDEPDTIPRASGEPRTQDEVRSEIARLDAAGSHKSVSWTGGEPLLHAGFLAEIMPWARGRGLKNYLETNGVLPAELKRLAPLCDVIAMDIKLPSATGRETWSAHREFLRVAPEKTFVKVVLTSSSTEAEWSRVVDLLREAGPGIPLVLQPATAVPDSRGTGRRVEPITPDKAEAFLNQAREVLKDVRVLPQQHPIWGIP